MRVSITNIVAPPLLHLLATHCHSASKCGKDVAEVSNSVQIRNKKEKPVVTLSAADKERIKYLQATEAMRMFGTLHETIRLQLTGSNSIW